MTMQRHVVAGVRAPATRATVPELPRACGDCTLRGAALCHAMRVGGGAGRRPPVARVLDRGRAIFEQGAHGPFLGVIRKGYARKSTVRPSGQRVLLGLALPGDVLGWMPGQLSPFDLEAATDVEICLHDGAGLGSRLREDRAVLAVILREIEEIHQRTLSGLWRYGTLNSRERIVAFMVSATTFMPTEPLPDGGLVLNVAIDRRDWADLTNTAVETISRTLRYLEEKDLVTCITPYRFRIRDLASLATLAGVEMPEGAGRAAPGGNRLGTRPGPDGLMTTVNAIGPAARSFEPAMRAQTAPRRGVSGGRQRHVEEIRS